MHPNVDQAARDALDDLGLIDNDNTEEMRKAPVAPDALQIEQPTSSHHNRSQKEF